MSSFEWDEHKNESNYRKHKLYFEKAQMAFSDKCRIILEDPEHSIEEERFFCIGKVEEEIITVRFTFRKKNIRIIGAGYWRRGKKIYEKENQI